MSPMGSSSGLPASLEFGRFRLLPHRRELLADGEPINLGGRAFDVLMVLIEAHGAVISKNALMERVWPDRVVEENNLQVQISSLRAALKADRNLVRTVSGRGYQFTGAIRMPPGSDQRTGDGAAAGVSGTILPRTNLAEPISELIGRDDELSDLLGLAAAHRLVSLTGPGGIGKTRLAFSVALRLLPQFTDGVWLAEFSPLADPRLLPVTVAAAAGLQLPAGEVSAQRLAQALSDRCLLLVLDTCEHVIDDAAELAQAVLQAGSAVRILVTSREPLRAEGEQIYPVPPLAVPAIRENPWESEAVQLFVARSRASGTHVAEELHGDTIAAICRQLDGIPLAIELAAARAAALSIEGLAARLDDRFNVLTGGRRTALPRHQTLRATFDWSYELLPETERVVLRRLTLFAGVFNLEAASAVVASPEIGPLDVIDAVSGLVAKSLVSVEGNGTNVRYRLLDTTRAYGLQKLDESGEREQLAHRHAAFLQDLFERAETEWETPPTAEWQADYRQQIDNVRAALDWAFSPDGDASIGVALTAAAIPLWMHLSLLEECRNRVEQALAASAGPDERREMKLQAALGESLMFTRGNTEEVRTAFIRALQLSEALDDYPYQLRVLRALHIYLTRIREFRGALVTGERSQSVARALNDPCAVTMADWMLGVAHHLLGNQVAAIAHCESAMTHPRTGDHRNLIHPGHHDRIIALVAFARALWLRGYPDQAAEAARYTVQEAELLERPLMLCISMIWTVYISLWVGDWPSAEAIIERIIANATRYSLGPYQSVGPGLKGELLIRRGQPSAGVPLLRRHLEILQTNRHQILTTVFATALAEGLTQLAEVDEALTALDTAIEQTGSAGESFDLPEMLRVKGKILRSVRHDVAGSEACLRQALDLAHRQGALSWELRAATDLARLLRDQGRSTGGIAILRPVYDRFTEGFDTIDLKVAKSLLDALEA